MKDKVGKEITPHCKVIFSLNNAPEVGEVVGFKYIGFTNVVSRGASVYVKHKEQTYLIRGDYLIVFEESEQ